MNLEKLFPVIYIRDDFCLFLFDLFLYVPVNIFTSMLGQVFLDSTRTKQGLMCLAQGHTAVPFGEAQTLNPRHCVASLSRSIY